MPPFKQKGNIHIEEEKTAEVPKQKNKFAKITKEKEPEKETIQLKKVPVKPLEPEKPVVTHKAEVIKHQNPELSVHGLHDRDDREIFTLGRMERVFTAEQETIQLSQIEETETIEIIQTAKKEGWTRTTKPKKEEEPEVHGVDKKKIKKLSKTDEPKESVTLKPFEKSGKLEPEQDQIRLKQVLSKPKASEREIPTETETTKQRDTEIRARKIQEREDQEIIPTGRPERVALLVEEPSKVGQTEEPKQPEEEEKSKWTRTTKPQKEGEPEPDVSKKKIKKLPKKDEEPEVVTLKPFEKPKKQESVEPAKPKDEVQTKTDAERSPFESGEILLKDQPTMALKNREDKNTSLISSDTTPDIIKSEPEIPQKKKVDKIPKDEESTAADKPKAKPKVISKPEKKEEQIMLKPFSKVTKPEKNPDDKMKKPVDTKVPDQKTKDLIDTAKEKPVRKEESAVPVKKVEDKKPTKPVEELKKVELKKTPSPKMDKPKDMEQVRPEQKSSSEKVKEIPKTASPKDSVEAMTLKKVPRKPSAEEATGPEKPDKGPIPMLKEISPGAVQMKRVTTQPEEEVCEKGPEEGEVEEESWGWDLVPSEDWEGEEVDGAVETPGMPGARRGETSKLFQLILESPHPIPDVPSNLHHIFFNHLSLFSSHADESISVCINLIDPSSYLLYCFHLFLHHIQPSQMYLSMFVFAAVAFICLSCLSTCPFNHLIPLCFHFIFQVFQVSVPM